jgi:hypothetical protein
VDHNHRHQREVNRILPPSITKLAHSYGYRS